MNSHFGNVFRELRIKADLTQEELGSRVNLSRQRVGALERGEAPMTAEEFVKLCLGLGVDLETPFALGNREFLEELHTRLPDVKRTLGMEGQLSEARPANAGRREPERLPPNARKVTLYIVEDSAELSPEVPDRGRVPPPRNGNSGRKRVGRPRRNRK